MVNHAPVDKKLGYLCITHCMTGSFEGSANTRETDGYNVESVICSYDGSVLDLNGRICIDVVILNHETYTTPSPVNKLSGVLISLQRLTADLSPCPRFRASNISTIIFEQKVKWP